MNYRDSFVKPLLTAPSTSEKGGFWAEGWNYGPLAIQNILLAEQALETAGLARESAGLAPGAEEHQWASEIIQSLISEQPTQATIYNGGDGYSYPRPFPDKNLVVELAADTADPTLRGYANFMIQNYAFSERENTPSLWLDLVYRNPSAPASFWPSFPLQYKADGQGLVTARADWNYNSTFVSLQLGNLVQADHQTFSPGMIQIFRGGDNLLVNVNAESGLQPDLSQYSNTVVINSNGDTGSDGSPVQTYPYNMGDWYGTPGVGLTSYDASPSFLYTGGDYRAAYSNSNDPGGGGPATKLTRQVVYLRPDLIIVHDRVATLKASYLKQLRWNFENQPTVAGNSFVEQVGSSKLFGQTFSDSPLVTTATSFNTQRDAQGNIIDPVGYDPLPFYEVNTNNSVPALGVTYTTAFETSSSTTQSMLSTTSVKSADGLMEGVLMGGSLVLFGKNGILPTTVSTITVNFAGATPSTELFVDLQPGKVYQVQVNGVTSTLKADAQGAISVNTGLKSTSVTVVASANPGAVGQPETLTATVAVVSPGTGTPTGTVTFKDGAVTLGTVGLATKNGRTTASVTTSKLVRGTHLITAIYNGDAGDGGSTSSILSVAVKNPTTVTLTPSVNPVGVGHAETLTATVKVLTPGAIPPTGTVTFKEGTAILGTATLATKNGVTTAALTTTKLGLGTHAITATYNGNVNDRVSTSTALSLIVRKPTSVVISTSTNPQSAGRSVTFTAVVKIVSPASGTPSGTVTFKEGTAILGTGTLATINGITKGTFTTKNLAVGTHAITATYNGDDNDLKSKSVALSQVVKLGQAAASVQSRVMVSRSRVLSALEAAFRRKHHS